MSRDIFDEVAPRPAGDALRDGAVGTPAGGLGDHGALAQELEARAGVHTRAPSGWFTRLIGYYLRRYEAQGAGPKGASERAVARAVAKPGQSVSDAARSAIRRASVKSALSGATAGTLSTAATLITAQTEGLAGLVAVPVAALGIGGEMLFRSLVHFELTVHLAELFDVQFDPADPADILRLYSLVFKTGDEEEATPDEPPSVGRDLVHKVKHLEPAEVGEQIGSKVLGESVMRNIVPFVGIVSSAVTNFVLTQRLGNTVRRYMRYQRAIDDAFERAAQECRPHLDLLVEGIWFIFTADGHLSPEETVTLVKLIERLDPVTGHATLSRFVEDELDWAERIEQLPPGMREPFFTALEVAACVDKEVSLPERKILRRAAHHLGVPFDLGRLDAMVREFEDSGVLSKASASQD
jgi:uncharacterized tellurite resistance protein B-like protein